MKTKLIITATLSINFFAQSNVPKADFPAALTKSGEIADISNKATRLLSGSFDSNPGIKNFREENKEIIKLASSNKPMKIIVGNSIRFSNTPLSDIKFCTNGSYPSVARIHNAAGPDERNAIKSGIAACIAGNEAGDYWANLNQLLKERFSDRAERRSATGTVGVFQLDKSPREGNQNICLDQFETWGIKSKLISGTQESNFYARAPDQKYNIACGTYLLTAAWLASHIRRNGQCAEVVPTQNMQFGSLHKARFMYCISQLANPAMVNQISSQLYRHNGFAWTTNKTHKI